MDNQANAAVVRSRRYALTLTLAIIFMLFAGFLYVFTATTFFGPPSIVAPIR